MWLRRLGTDPRTFAVLISLARDATSRFCGDATDGIGKASGEGRKEQLAYDRLDRISENALGLRSDGGTAEQAGYWIPEIAGDPIDPAAVRNEISTGKNDARRRSRFCLRQLSLYWSSADFPPAENQELMSRLDGRIFIAMTLVASYPRQNPPTRLAPRRRRIPASWCLERNLQCQADLRSDSGKG